MRKLTHKEIFDRCIKICEKLKIQFKNKIYLKVYPVPRGGVPAVYALGEIAVRRGIFIIIVDAPERADFIVDDLVDSGRTRDSYEQYGVPFFALFSKHVSSNDLPPKEWVVFPWEGNEEKSADDIPVRLLQYIGEDVQRGGLVETPKRFLKAWKFYTSGYNKDPAEILKVFEDGAEEYDEMVLVKDIPFYSQCEHHLAPFFGVAHIAYIPDGKIVGLSKFSRLLDMYARRLQVQERLTNQVATALQEVLKPKGVAVVISARHMCMESRGVCQQGHSTTTSAMFGAFKDEHDTRAEFLELIK